jgi:SulP family sulfate permease
VFFARWTAWIPFATLGAILVIVAYHMSEWRAFRSQFRAPRSDLVVMLTTFVLTVLVDLTVALQVGMVLAAFLFMKRMSEVTNVQAVTREFEDAGDPYATDPDRVRRRLLPPGVEVYEINGPFFFGAARSFQEQVESVLGTPKVMILRMRNVPAMDSTGMHALGEVVRRARGSGTLVLLSDVHSQPMMALGRSHLLDEIGDDHIFGSIEDALEYVRLRNTETGPVESTPV